MKDKGLISPFRRRLTHRGQGRDYTETAGWAEQTTKGYMWEDIGLGDWLFNLDDEPDIPQIVPALLAMAKNPDAAKARQFVQKRQLETMEQLRRELA